MDSLNNSIARIKTQQELPDTFTENGAHAFSTTKSACLDLFASAVRDTSRESMEKLVERSFNEDVVKTLAILLNLRDAREGKGEKKITYYALLWLRRNYPLLYLYNLPTFVKLGYCKDLCLITEIVHKEGMLKLGQKSYIELEYLADMLKDDFKKSGDISLVAKWAPTEKGYFDKNANGSQARTLAKLIFPDDQARNKRYRKELSRLREELKVVEKLMAENRWEEINFSHVPSKAHRILRNAFGKHQADRYYEYLNNVKKGTEKINTSGVQPHELVRNYLIYNSKIDNTIEVQWDTLVKKLADKGSLNRSLAIVDVSGSMNGEPIQVAVSLGLLTSQLTAEPFKDYVVTFSDTPALHYVGDETLLKKVNNIRRMSWQMNTNLLAVFDLLLYKAQECNVSREDMIDTLFIFTDMQFDSAISRRGGKWDTVYENIRTKYERAGYDVPNIVFWNLRATKPSFPVQKDTPGVALLSGFSGELLKLFMEGDDLTPISLMNRAIQPYIELVRIN